jgi:hypothetical protein
MAEERFTAEDLSWAADQLGMLPYFPHESRAAVITLLAKMCPDKRALRWLIDATISHAKVWPGPSELRGLLCTRYNAADGIDEPSCSIPGFTAEEAEAKFLAQHENVKVQSQLPVPEMAAVRQIAAGKSIEATKGELNQLERLGCENRYNTPDLSYFGLHTRTDLLQGANFLHKLYWHSRVPFHDERVGLIIAMRDGDQFLEVVGAVLAKMAWVRNRQKAFKFQPEAKTA